MSFASDNRSPIMKRIAGAITGVGAGQVAIAKIPPGVTYNEIAIQCTIGAGEATRANLEAMITQLRLTVSGVEKWTLTGKQLIAIVEFYRSGTIGDSGYLVIPFERLWMFSTAAALDPAYGTLGESSFQLEITQSGGSTIDAMNLWARISPVAESLGAHVKMVRLTPNIAATGVYYYPDLPKTPGLAAGNPGLQYLYALHFEVPVVANLTNIAYVADEIRVVDVPPAFLNQLYIEANPSRTVQTAKGFVHLDFANRGYDGDGIPLNMNSQILELTFDNAAPNGVTIIAEIGTKQPTQASAG